MADIFEQFGALLGNEAFAAVNAVVSATLTDIQTNPQAWLNPLSGPVKGAAVVAQLAAAVPTLESSGVTSAAQLVAVLWQKLGAQLAAAAPTPATIAGEVAPAAPAGGTVSNASGVEHSGT
jgi:hypothetical protein